MTKVNESCFSSPLCRFKIDKFHFIISLSLLFQGPFVYIYHEVAYNLTSKNIFTWFLCFFTQDFLLMKKAANKLVLLLKRFQIILYTFAKSRLLKLVLFKEFTLLSLAVLESLDEFYNGNFHGFSYFSLKYALMSLSKNYSAYFQFQLFH